MDFKSLMSAQISKSKTSPPPTANNATSNKYKRRAEIAAAEEAAYQEKQAQLEAEREGRAAKKRRLEGEEAEKAAVRQHKMRQMAAQTEKMRREEEKEAERQRRKRLRLPELEDGEGAEKKELSDDMKAFLKAQDINNDQDLRTKLRALDEPVAVYNEDFNARLVRFRSLIEGTVTKPTFSNGPIPTSLEPVPEKDLLLPSPLPSPNTPAYIFLHRQLASYFTLLLSEWQRALDARPSEVQSSQAGRAASTSYKGVLRDLTPLFRHFESLTLPASLLEPICAIVSATQSRRYVVANDAYLTLSIGKAAWPIGVTMVGIHERSAREKLHDGQGANQAHIMSDEVTRKFLQSIKRCISFAQTRWPPEDLGQLMG
jgi:pre-mRNA-splicing factor 18